MKIVRLYTDEDNESHFEDIEVEYDHGTTLDVRMHDGSSLRLRKIRSLRLKLPRDCHYL